MKNPAFQGRLWSSLGQYLLLTITAIIILYPIWSAFNISMMSDAEMGSFPPLQFPSAIRLSNIERALTQAPLTRYLLNSIVQSSLVMVGQLVAASLAAYAFAFIDFKGRNIFFLLFLSTMMIPW